jgi:hypothetical protein
MQQQCDGWYVASAHRNLLITLEDASELTLCTGSAFVWCLHAAGGVAYLNFFGTANNAYYQPAFVFPLVSATVNITKLVGRDPCN